MSLAQDRHVDDLALVARCLDARFEAWEELIRRLQRPVYTLVVRFVWSVHDAEDVTQEVLLKVVTVLHSYRGEAALTTWAYRIASRHLIDLARRPSEALTFDEGREHLLVGLAEPEWAGPEATALAGEVKIGCSTAVLDLPGPDAAWVLDVDPTVHRKRPVRGQARRLVADLDTLGDDLAIMRSNPDLDPVNSVLTRLRELVTTGGL